MNRPRASVLCFVLALGACRSAPESASSIVADAKAVPYAASAERPVDFTSLLPADSAPREPNPELALERISAGVPWPRGLAWVDGELVVLARGRHRRAGGVDHSIEDHTGSLFRVDPDVAEPVVPGRLASPAVAANARLLARADARGPFHLPDRTKEPIDDHLMDRPYCTLIWDAPSRNLFICGYSGVDLPGSLFRKNATDSIHRYDLRSEAWYPVEMHDPNVVPRGEQSYVVSNAYYPHHDPAANPPPHGWLNGPDGGCVAGRYLYCTAKDNHLVVQYDLETIREDPEAGPPESRPVLGPRVRVRYPGGERETELLGPSAAAVWGEHLYVGYRTSSVVVRFALEPDGALVQPPVAELIAVFQPWDAEAGESANLIDLAFDSQGELYVSCSTQGRVWRVGLPDPDHPFRGDDREGRRTSLPPYLDLSELTGKKTTCGNILIDDQDRLYVCAGNYDTDSPRIAGAIYRAVRASG